MVLAKLFSLPVLLLTTHCALGEEAETCIDPTVHQLVTDQIASLQNEVAELSPQVATCMEDLKYCRDNAVDSETLETLQRSIQEAEAKLQENEFNANEAVSRKESQIQELMNKPCAGNSVLFSSDQLMGHAIRFSGFMGEVYQQLVAWAPVKDALQRMREAKVEIQTAADPHLQKLNKQYQKVMVIADPKVEMVKNIYKTNAAPHVSMVVDKALGVVKNVSSVVDKGVQQVNHKISMTLQPVFEARPQLKEYIPEQPLDRSLCAVYLLIAFYIFWKILCMILSIFGWFVSRVVFCGCLKRPKRKEMKRKEKKEKKEEKDSEKQNMKKVH